MAVNNAFYSTLNELTARRFEGANAGTRTYTIVDYDSFCDAGKALADMEFTDLVNDFLNPLINKVRATIHEVYEYKGALVSMYMGSIGNSYGVLEVLMGNFYSASASVFDGDTLEEGETYGDLYKVDNLPDVAARYYTLYDSWEIPITIRQTDLQAAFKSPDAMDGFIKGIFVDVANSAEAHRETNRMNTLNAVISDKLGTTPEVSDENKPAQVYNLLRIYNAKKGTSLTEDTCFYNNDFATFCASVIRTVSGKLKKPSLSYNLIGDRVTFTPESKLSLYVNGELDASIRRSLVDAYNPEYGMLTGKYEVLPYWQDETKPLQISLNDVDDESVVWSDAKIVAALCDDRIMGEFANLQDVTTAYQPRRKFVNYFYQYSSMYFRNPYANGVVFIVQNAPTPAPDAT